VTVLHGDHQGGDEILNLRGKQKKRQREERSRNWKKMGVRQKQNLRAKKKKLDFKMDDPLKLARKAVKVERCRSKR